MRQCSERFVALEEGFIQVFCSTPHIAMFPTTGFLKKANNRPACLTQRDLVFQCLCLGGRAMLEEYMMNEVEEEGEEEEEDEEG